MKNLIILLVAIFVCASAQSAIELVEDYKGQQYYLVPVIRHRRQAKTDIGVHGPGVQADVKHSGIILNNDSHKVDGSVSLSKQFAPDSPITAQGKINYLHKDSGSGLSAMARQNEFGTDVKLQGKYNLYQNGKFGVDATGGYQRHFDGPGGTRSPQWNTWIRGHYDF